MIREEEIRQVASAYAIDEVKDTCNPASKRSLLYSGFIDGAQWADAHNEGLNMHIKYLKEELIDNACAWLERNYHATPSGGYYYLPEDCIEQFRKAMEGD